MTIEQAVDAEQKVKVVFIDNTKAYYDAIYFKNDSLLCGVTRTSKSEIIETIIPEEQIKEQIGNVDKYGGVSTEFITAEGERYIFDSFYFKNDTLYGQKKVKKRIEILIPISSIKEIHLISKGASGAATTVVILVGGWALACFVVAILWLIYYRHI